MDRIVCTTRPRQVSTSRKHVEAIFFLVDIAVCEPEQTSRNELNQGCGNVVPDEERVFRERHKGLAQSSCNSAREQGEGLDQASHVLGCLGESIFEGCHRGEDLRACNQDVTACLRPDIDWRPAIRLSSRLFRNAYRGLVDVMLNHRGPDHRSGSEHEARENLFDRGKTDTDLSKKGLDKEVKN
jgi:hypothetical protein